MFLKYVLYAVIAVASIGFLSDWIFSLFDDPKEPPRARSRIPLFGHAYGLLSKAGEYYVELAPKQKSEIYTLGLFSLKIYVINSRRMIPLVQRQASNLSFKPFLVFALKAFVGASKTTQDLHADPTFLNSLYASHKDALSPGPHLDYQNERANESLNDLIDETLRAASKASSGAVQLELYSWVRHIITIAATDGVFGTSNPFLKEENRQAFWDWQKGALLIWAGLGPFVSKAVKGRERLVKAFADFHRGDYSDAAFVIRERARLMSENGASDEEIARHHLLFAQGVMPNTVPTSFWTVFEVFSRPELLKRLRDAITEHGITRNDATGDIEIDVAALKTRVPLLLAVLEETQRTRGNNASIRIVQEDTMLGDFKLKKGSYLQIPHQPVHHDGTIWGDDTAHYNPDRFLGKSYPPNSLAPWGVAPHLCPARQFASTEIMVMIALLVLRVDIIPVGGVWRELQTSKKEQATIPPPKEELQVELRPREGWNGRWILKMGESKTKVALSSG